MTTRGMRALLILAAALVFLIGVPLFLFPGSTDDTFSWTVEPPLTAAFFGAGYWAAGVLELRGAAEPRWSVTRVAVPAVLVFTTATLIVTLLHLDRFHFDHPSLVTRLGTWGWLIVYGVVPPLMLLALASQLRSTGWGGHSGKDPVSLPLRTAIAAGGLALTAYGLALLVVPESAGGSWPWALSALTGRAVGGWILGMGVILGHIAVEGDWQRSRPATAAAGAFALLEGFALVRHVGEPNWARPVTWGYVAALVALGALGVAGWRRPGRPDARFPGGRASTVESASDVR